MFKRIKLAADWLKRPINSFKLLPVPFIFIGIGMWRESVHAQEGCIDGFLQCSNWFDTVFLVVTLTFIAVMAVLINVGDWSKK